jgi:hypothetical protein
VPGARGEPLADAGEQPATRPSEAESEASVIP